MKTRLLIIILFVAGLINLSHAQKYPSFGVGVGLGIVPPMSPGFLLYLEPSLRVSKAFAVGVRVETVGRAGYADIPILGSYTINALYYLNKGPARVFFGLGTGLYTTNSALLASNSGTGEGTPRKTVWGVYPRLGIKYKHLVTTMDINFVQSVRALANSDGHSTPPAYYDANAGYISMKIGWLFGGGGS